MKKVRLMELHKILINNGYITDDKNIHDKNDKIVMTLTDDEFDWLLKKGLISHM